MIVTKFPSFVRDGSGNTVEGATVTVYKQGQVGVAGQEATIYSDEIGTVISGSTVTTAADGYYEFYVAQGDYDLRIAKSGYTFRDIIDISIGKQSNPTVPPVTSGGYAFNASRIMWNCNAYNPSPIVSRATPTEIEMLRITGTYKCNILQFDGCVGLPEAEIEGYLSLCEQFNVKAILGLYSTTLQTSIAAFVTRWEADERVIAFSVRSTATNSHLSYFQTNKPLVLEYHGTYGTLVKPTNLTVPIILAPMVFEIPYGANQDPAPGIYAGVSPPSMAGDVIATLMNVFNFNWRGFPFIPVIPFFATYQDLAAPPPTVPPPSLSYSYTPAATELADYYNLVGGDSFNGVIFDSWGKIHTRDGLGEYYKYGLKWAANDTDTFPSQIRQVFCDAHYGASLLGSTKGLSQSHQNIQNSYDRNLLLNPHFFYDKSSATNPMLWEVTSPSGLTIDHNLLQNDHLVEMSVAPACAATLVQRIDVPAWMALQFNKKPVVYRIIGGRSGSASVQQLFMKLSLLDVDGVTIGNSVFSNFAPGEPVALYMSLPMVAEVRYISVSWTFSATVAETFYVNDQWLGFGMPQLGLGNNLHNSVVHVGGVSKDVVVAGEHFYAKYPMVPLRQSFALAQGVAVANSTSFIDVSIPSPEYDSFGEDAQFQGSRGFINAQVTLTNYGPAGLNEVFADVVGATDEGDLVTVRLLNTNAVDDATVLLHVTVTTMPMKYQSTLG